MLLDIFVLWAAALAAYGLVALAVRTRDIEREHGLRRSRHHVTAVGVIFSLVLLVATGGTISGLVRNFSSARVPARANSGGAAAPWEEHFDVAKTAEQLAALEQQRTRLEEQLAALQHQIAVLREGRAVAPGGRTTPVTDETNVFSPAGEGPGVPSLLLFTAPAVVIIGVVLLLVLSNREVLVRSFLGRFQDKGELRLRTLANLDRLCAAADKGEFREGLACADEIEPHLLDRFESMNLLFLRAYCAVQHAMSGVSDTERQRRLEEASRGLKTLLEEAPNHAEAMYLLAIAEGFIGRSAEALKRFIDAEGALGKTDLPLAHNKSVCLLRLAEERLIQGDADQSGKLLDQVTRLKVLADQIPTALVKVRLLSVREGLQTGRLAEAREGIEVVRQLEGFEPEQHQNVELVCDAYQTLISIHQGNDQQVVREIDDFLAKHCPSGLPPADEDIADEYLEAPIATIELRVDARVFGAFLFLKAAVLARAVAKTGKHPSVEQTGEIIRTLLTALQFELRQRDLLAALGGVYYWFVPDKRVKAISWLESAVALGVESRLARRILERDKRIEVENREALEWFRSATGRFLHDPTVSNHVRQALIEELGRFRGFQPLLLELDRQTDLEPQEPTVRLLRERAEYMEQVVADFAGRKAAAIQAEFNELRKEYARLIASLDAATGRMAEIERRFVHEVGKSVLS